MKTKLTKTEQVASEIFLRMGKYEAGKVIAKLERGLRADSIVLRAYTDELEKAQAWLEEQGEGPEAIRNNEALGDLKEVVVFYTNKIDAMYTAYNMGATIMALDKTNTAVKAYKKFSGR